MKKFSKKAIILIAVVAALFTAAVVSTVAFIVANTTSLTNTFTPGKVGCEVVETFDKSTKEDVKLKNAVASGDNKSDYVDAYLRAAIVITWQDASGNVYPTAPAAGTDYTITQTASGWTLHTDGYWYYNSPVAPDGTTANLIDSVAPVADKAPAGYSLCVEILGQSIQAEPASAIADAWGYTPSSN